MDDCQVIALKTLRQRCDYLQQQLNAVEEENCKLRLETTQDINAKTSEDLSKLEQQIILLNKEKSQMAHQIQMITNENSTLWFHLSKILPENSILNLKVSISTAPHDQVLKLNPYDNAPSDCSKEKLEEISLKLINGIITGKNELEKQYSEMVDLQRENVDYLPFKFNEIDSRIPAKNFNDYIQKLKDFKETLLKQKVELSSAISFIKNSLIVEKQSNNVNKSIPNFSSTNYCKISNLNSNQPGCEFSTVNSSGRIPNVKEKLDITEEKICPLCGKNVMGSMEDFEKHVISHFDEEHNESSDINTMS